LLSTANSGAMWFSTQILSYSFPIKHNTLIGSGTTVVVPGGGCD
jgi:hypothetical protein